MRTRFEKNKEAVNKGRCWFVFKLYFFCLLLIFFRFCDSLFLEDLFDVVVLLVERFRFFELFRWLSMLISLIWFSSIMVDIWVVVDLAVLVPFGGRYPTIMMSLRWSRSWSVVRLHHPNGWLYESMMRPVILLR